MSVIYPNQSFADVPTSVGRLSGSFVYIYSFLDIRSREFGPRLLDQIDRQVAADFAAKGVRSKLLHFEDSEVGRDLAGSASMGDAGIMIPVGETLRSNSDDERDVGASYRLVEFPVYAEAVTVQRFQIRWDLYDVASNKLVWSKTYSNVHFLIWKNDEDAENRAKAMVDRVMSDLATDGFLN